MPHFGFIPIKPSFLLGEEAFNAITGDYVRALEALGGERWAADAIPDDKAQLFLLVATGGTEEVILKVWAERSKTAAGEPVFLIAHPGNNSLPAVARSAGATATGRRAGPHLLPQRTGRRSRAARDRPTPCTTSTCGARCNRRASGWWARPRTGSSPASPTSPRSRPRGGRRSSR